MVSTVSTRGIYSIYPWYLQYLPLLSTASIHGIYASTRGISYIFYRWYLVQYLPLVSTASTHVIYSIYPWYLQHLPVVSTASTRGIYIQHLPVVSTASTHSIYSIYPWYLQHLPVVSCLINFAYFPPFSEPQSLVTFPWPEREIPSRQLTAALVCVLHTHKSSSYYYHMRMAHKKILRFGILEHGMGAKDSSPLQFSPFLIRQRLEWN